jgi:hypothetical protein
MARNFHAHSSNAVRHSAAGFDILVSIPSDIYDMANAQLLSFILQFAWSLMIFVVDTMSFGILS